MRVLYLHPAGAYGGASKSLIELFRQLRTQGVAGTVLTPRGAAADAFAEAGLKTIHVRGLPQFDNTRYGHYRGVRWLILLRELFFLPGALAALWRLQRGEYDIVHANEVALLPLAIAIKKRLGVPMVVHVRSLQCQAGSSWRTGVVNGWLGRFADAIVPIDHTVARTLDARLNLHVVHNGLTVAPLPGSGATRRPDPAAPVRVGFMGILIALKGIHELVEAMRILKDRGVAIECIIAGENARELRGARAWMLRKLGFATDVRAELEQRIRQYGLERQVRLLGFVKDVQTLYQTLDILCFPSHLNAAGRPVFEAAFFGIPSVVAIDAPLPDAVLHEQTGLAIPAPVPQLIADALQRLAEDEPFRIALGGRARAWAIENFSIESSASAIRAIYRNLAQPAGVHA